MIEQTNCISCGIYSTFASKGGISTANDLRVASYIDRTTINYYHL